MPLPPDFKIVACLLPLWGGLQKLTSRTKVRLAKLSTNKGAFETLGAFTRGTFAKAEWI
jgi:hypothetical protein